ncbi:MAG TPA: DNA-processing protein DprA [Gammaproteobacteria bacterium]|nr:DNA-processing protein DprA [Gammaproteobacteria bacterium]
MADEAWLGLLEAARRERAWDALLTAAGSPDALRSLSDAKLAAAGASAESIARFRAPDAATLDAWRAWLAAPGHALIPRGSAGYPDLLASIPDAPLALWIDGARPELLAAPQIAVVGSRNATRGGRETAERFARFLAESGLTITSGLAAGIDEAGHRGALGTDAATVAVLGCGIDRVFPRANARLYREIAAAGLLVSEYPPGVPPRGWQFPDRNRIIAGLSLGTLVVEAGRRSGALITARLATELGREVFAIPGSIHNPLARGCHALIRQGAKLVEEGADVLVELRSLLELEPSRRPALENVRLDLEKDAGEPREPEDPAYKRLLETLGYEPASLEQLASECALTAGELSSMLLILELEGFVEALPGGRYCRLPARSR